MVESATLWYPPFSVFDHRPIPPDDMLPFDELLFLLVIVPLLWFWIDSLRARELAVRAAAQACAEEGLQLLDETVSGQRVRPCRNDEGRLGLRREFGFEFTDTGDNRRRGNLVLESGQVALVQLHPQLYIVPRQDRAGH